MALTKRRPLPFFSTKPNGPERGTLKKIKKKKKQHSNTVDATRCNLSAQFGPRSSQKAKLFGTNDVGGSPTGFVSYFLFFLLFFIADRFKFICASIWFRSAFESARKSGKPFLLAQFSAENWMLCDWVVFFGVVSRLFYFRADVLRACKFITNTN